jgi:hypothetical protein
MKRLLILLHNQQQRHMNDGKDDGIGVERHLLKKKQLLMCDLTLGYKFLE